MINQEDFYKIIEEVVNEVFPSETIAFQMGGKELIDDIYTKEEIRETNAFREFNFLENTESVLSFIAIIITIYQFLFLNIKWFIDKRKRQKLLDELKDVLTKKELSPKEVNIIVKIVDKSIK